jgi:hypothetical protein
MDFIRKNWGLLLYALGCLILAGVVGFKAKQAHSLGAGKRKALDEQLRWFDDVKKANVRLSKENETAARDNAENANRDFTTVRQDLASKYRVDPDHPATAVEAVRALRDELIKTRHMLDTAEPPLDYRNCAYLSFENRAESSDLPTLEDVPKIFRQLRIVQEIVRIACDAHLGSLNAIQRPMDLDVVAEDLYTATPIMLDVTGTADQIQTFINKMATEANYLFFLRNLTLETPDQAPNGALGGASGASGVVPSGGQGTEGGMGPGGPGGPTPGMRPGSGPGATGPAGPGAMMEGGGMGPGTAGAMMAAPAATGNRPARAPRGRRPAATAAGPSPAGTPATMGPGAMGPAMAGPGARMPGATLPGGGDATGAVSEEPMVREDLRVFMQDNLVTAALRYDLIEFNQPEAASPQQP